MLNLPPKLHYALAAVFTALAVIATVVPIPQPWHSILIAVLVVASALGIGPRLPQNIPPAPSTLPVPNTTEEPKP